MRELRTESLAQFVEMVSAIRKEWSEPEWIQPWFRGQSNAAFGLVPGALRESNPISLIGEDGKTDLSSSSETNSRGERYS